MLGVLKVLVGLTVALALTVACGTPPAKTYPVMPAALAPITLTHDRATAFGRIFCGTLQHFQDPKGRSWGDCGQYVDHATMSGTVPMAFTSRFRLLLVGGMGDDCLADRARAFAEGITHLHEVHQVDVEAVRTPPFASSTDVGHVIARIVNERWMADPAHRPYVLLGYSKGAADIEEATRELPMIRDQVAAVVTIAGLVNGTREQRALAPLFQAGRPWTDHHCPTMGPLLSLSPTVRHDFLREHPLPVPRIPRGHLHGIRHLSGPARFVETLESLCRRAGRGWRRLGRGAA